ncbi:MAG TPA: ion channel [Burkholderiales bacterium]|nr:ion channel [Burkholderiales bacterium]
MTVHVGHWFGIGGVAPEDNHNAHLWEKRLDGVMIAIAALSIPVALTELQSHHAWIVTLGNTLHWFILAAFSAELIWMVSISSRKFAYLTRNWLNVVIILVALLGLVGITSGVWIASARMARVALVGLLLARAFSGFGSVLIARGVPLVLGLSFLMLLLAGLGFYFLEPTVRSYGEGIWLAFVTGSTVGYGDFVPTTTASRVFAVIMVLVGFALLSMVTATISAFFIGADERRLRLELHQDIRRLHAEVRELREELGRQSKKKSSSGDGA